MSGDFPGCVQSRPTELDCHYLRFIIGHSKPDDPKFAPSGTQAWIEVHFIQLRRSIAPAQAFAEHKVYAIRSTREPFMDEGLARDIVTVLPLNAAVPEEKDIIYQAIIAVCDMVDYQHYRKPANHAAHRMAHPFADVVDAIPLPPNQWPLKLFNSSRR
jgi:hypothetical protein